MADEKYAKIQAKLDKGEALNKEELKDVMSQPGADSEGADEVDWDKVTGGEDEGKGDEGKSVSGKNTKDDSGKTDEGGEASGDKTDKDVDGGSRSKEVPGSGQKLNPFQQREKDRIEKVAHKEELRDELARIERGEKPRFNEEPGQYSNREKAYFQEVLAERKARQKAELDLETYKFHQVKKQELEKANPVKEKIEEPINIEDDGFVTGADLKKIVQGLRDKPVQDQQQVQPQQVANLKPYLKVCEKAVREKFEDTDEVLELYSKIISDNPVYLKRIGDAMNAGDNAVEVTYNIIKNDPSFDDLIDEAKATVARRNPKPKTPATEKTSQEFEQKEKRVKQNLEKPKTTGNFSGGSETGNEDEITAQDLMNMSDAQFAKIPKAKRTKLLQQFGM